MSFYRNSYGVELGESGYRTKFKGPPVMPAEPKPNAVYVAEIVGWREGKTDWSVNARVMDADGHALINPNWQIGLWWPGATEPGSRPNNTHSARYPQASTYSLEEMLNGVEIRSQDAYVNNEGGPFVAWLDGPDIESPMWRVGWAGNHYYTGPYLRVRRKDGSSEPGSGSGSVDVDAVTDAVIRRVGVTMVDMGKRQ